MVIPSLMATTFTMALLLIAIKLNELTIHTSDTSALTHPSLSSTSKLQPFKPTQSLAVPSHSGS